MAAFGSSKDQKEARDLWEGEGTQEKVTKSTRVSLKCGGKKGQVK